MKRSGRENKDVKSETFTSAHVVTQDGKKIYFDHYRSAHAKVIILAHGFYNSKKAVLFKNMAEDLLDVYDVIVMDFRGHGQSEGFFDWTAKEYMDVEAVLVYARQHYKTIGVIGFSLGAASCLVAATRTELITSLIAVSPPTEFGKIEKHFWKMGVAENIIYNVFDEGRIGKGVRPGKLWLKKTRPIDIVEDIKVPILFIHGKKDWLILPWHSTTLFEKATGNKKLIMVDEGTHAEYLYRRDRVGTIRMFKEWFATTL